MAATIRLLSRGLALLAALLALTGVAAGHAVVLETVPADGALLERAPREIVVRFNEPVRPIAAQVLDADGRAVTGPDALSGAGEIVRIALPPRLAEGSYIASYRVVSVDSHPVGGSLVFSVGWVSSRVAVPMETDDSGWRLAMIAVRTLMHAGLLGGAGGVLFLLLVRPGEPVPARRSRRIAAALAASGGVAAILAIGVQGGLLLAGPAASLAEAATWRIGAASPFGAAAITAAIGLALVAAGLWPRRSPILRSLAWLGAATALASFALSGHVVTAGPRWITVPLLLAHTTAAAFWVGSLAPLLWAVAELHRAAAPLVARFSRIAVGAVAVLLAAGLGIAVVQVERTDALVTTSYGLILIAKLALVAGLIALAAVNKLRLTPALARGEPGAGSALQSTIAAEIGLATAILVATAALAATPPPRALAGEAASHAGHVTETHEHHHAAGLSVTIAGGGGSAEVALASAASGVNEADIRLLDRSGAPLEAQEVTFIAANPAAGVEPIRRAAEATVAGAWRVDELLLVPAGRWSLRLDVLVSDFEKMIFETEVELR